MSKLVIAPPRDARALDSAEAFLNSILRPSGARTLHDEHPAVFGRGLPVGVARYQRAHV